METNAETWVDEHGDYLFRYALRRLRQREAAEDVVQETFLAALRGRAQFAGASTMRTWLTGILKRKIVDHLRCQSREQPISNRDAQGEWTDKLFDERGNWKIKPETRVADPGLALEKREFWTVLSSCLSKLPQRLADAFTLRAIDGLDGHDVCKVMDVSANNLWVMLHRARLQLSRCLEINWFGNKK